MKCLLLKEQSVTSRFAKRVEPKLENASGPSCLFAEHIEDREMGWIVSLVFSQLNPDWPSQ